MGSIKVERIDHLGIVAGVIQDLGTIEMIDSRITPDEREEIHIWYDHQRTGILRPAYIPNSTIL